MTMISVSPIKSKAPDIVLISTADWDNPYWTNKQHMAVEFARRGHRVFYVESQGLRAPTATGKDFKRIIKRLKTGVRAPRQPKPNIWVWSPLVVPLHRFGLVRALNRTLLKVGMKFWCAWNGIRPDILWTYSPLTTELYDLSAYPTVVYHAVDDVKMQPGVPYDAVAQGEVELAKQAHLIFTTAPKLQTFYEAINPRTYFYSNVADYHHFNTALSSELAVPQDIARMQKPVIGFVGAISSYKLDFELIQSIARSRPDWSFVFIGEIGEGDPLTDASTLKGNPNIHLLGGRPYATLPSYLKGMDVAIIPSLINDYTRSMSPMKFFEYLAAGKPVVATPLAALEAYPRVVQLRESASAFEDGIVAALNGGASTLEERLAVAREHTYEARTEKMWGRVEQMLEARRLAAHGAIAYHTPAEVPST
jgi:glycosyltransferase involved in cell wall biosynthesis